MKPVKDLAILEEWARKHHDPTLYGYQNSLVHGLFFLRSSVLPKQILRKVWRHSGPLGVQ